MRLNQPAPARRPGCRGRVLVIDDEPGIRRLAVRALGADGFHVDAAGEAGHGLDLALAGCYDLVVLDLELPGADGAGLLWRILTGRPGQAVMIWSASADAAARRRCLGLGARGYLSKAAPWRSSAPACVTSPPVIRAAAESTGRLAARAW